MTKNGKVTNFDPLPLKNYDWKKSEKIQGNSWDGYEVIQAVQKEKKNFTRPSVRELGIYMGYFMGSEQVKILNPFETQFNLFKIMKKTQKPNFRAVYANVQQLF